MVQAKMKVAIIGCGNVARGHIRAWQDSSDAEVAMLVDVEVSLARNTQAEMDLDEAIPISEDYEDALRSEEIDIVDICTPSHLHTPQIIEALTASKHIVVEKPTGYDLEECRRLKFYRQKYPDPKVAVAYSLRYYPLNIEVKRLIDAGRIGDLISGQFTWEHPFDPEYLRKEGVPHPEHLADKGGKYIPSSQACGPTHVFDLSRYLFGEVEEVFAYHSEYGVYALTAFENKAMGILTTGVTSSWGLQNPTVLCIQGTEGTIHTVVNRQGEYTGTLIERDKETVIEADKDTGHGDRTRTRNIINAIQEDEPLICPLEDSIRTSEFLHAIGDSYTLGIRVPVHMSGKTG